jgi:magnesium-transporting ATPase (P-type)
VWFRPLHNAATRQDLKLFAVTNAELLDSRTGDAQPVVRARDGAFRFRLVQRFDFTADLRRSSVVAVRAPRDLDHDASARAAAAAAAAEEEAEEEGNIMCFVKGAPEGIVGLCRPASVPVDHAAVCLHAAGGGADVERDSEC